MPPGTLYQSAPLVMPSVNISNLYALQGGLLLPMKAWFLLLRRGTHRSERAKQACAKTGDLTRLETQPTCKTRPAGERQRRLGLWSTRWSPRGCCQRDSCKPQGGVTCAAGGDGGRSVPGNNAAAVQVGGQDKRGVANPIHGGLPSSCQKGQPWNGIGQP